MSKRHVAAQALRASGVGPALLGRGRWRGVLILTYHRILPGPPPGRFAGVWSATPDGFAEQMALVARGCDVVGLDDVRRLHASRGRHVAITFDDGYRDNHRWALPVLREHGLPATVFVATGLVDGTALPWWDELAWLRGGLRPGEAARFGDADDVVGAYWAAGADGSRTVLDAVAAASARPRLTPADVRDEWMTWDHVRELRAAGVTIGAHTVTHPLLSTLDEEGQRAEIVASADRIAAEVGERPTVLAYPVGSRTAFDARSKAAARAAGLRTAYSLYGGPTTASLPWDPYDVPRVAIDARHDRTDVEALLALPRVFGRGAAPPVATAPGSSPIARAAARRARPRGRRGGSDRIRTVTLVDRLIHGGAERMAYALTRDLDPDRFDRVLCVTAAGHPAHAAPGTEPAAWRAELLDAGVRLVELDRARRSEPRGWAPLVAQLRRTDVLHAHMFVPNACAAVLGPAVGVPVTVTHEHAWSHTGGRHQAAVERRIVAPRATAMLACSVAVRERMVVQDRLPDERVVVLPNGIEGRAPAPGRDVRAELGIPADAPVVGSVGALRDIKRFDVLIDAVDRVRRRRPDVRLLVAGDGDERAALEAQVARLGLGETVVLLGARGDVPDVIAAFDVAVSSSDAEASPLSVMEYMDGGRPVVATAVGGVPELLDDGVHGRLVPRRDPDAMADALVALLEDPATRTRMGEAGRARRRAELGLDVMVDRLEALYVRLLAGGGPGGG